MPTRIVEGNSLDTSPKGKKKKNKKKKKKKKKAKQKLMRWIQALIIFGENCKFHLTLTTTKFITKVYSHCWILAYGKVVLLLLRCAIF